MLSRLFGRKKEDSPPKRSEVDLPEAILRNKGAIETLEKRQVHLEKRIVTQEEEARKRAKEGDKRGALFALKRKKLYENELEQLGNAHLTLEQQIMTLESAQAQQVAVGALAAGVSAQKALNQQLNIRKIDDLMEDLHEQASAQQELSQVLYHQPFVADDAELLEELHQIEAKQLEEALVDAASPPVASIQAVASSSSLSPPLGTTTRTSIGSSPPRPQLTDEEQLQHLLNQIS